MQTSYPSASRRASSLRATSRVCSFSLRPYLEFTAPGSLPPCPASRTTSPLHPASCAPAPETKAPAARQPAIRSATNIDAHTLREPLAVTIHPFRKVFDAGSLAPNASWRIPQLSYFFADVMIVARD